MGEEDKYEIAIIGSGAAGLSAAIYARRYNRKIVVVEGKNEGGYTAVAATIENYPGVKSIDGFDLAKIMREQAEDLGAEFFSGYVQKVEKKGEGDFVLTTSSGEVNAQSVILAHGTEHRRLGLEREEELLGKGVSICAVCDAPVFKDKTVVMVGGGDSSVKAMSLLCDYAKFVYLITREKTLHAEPINLKRMQTKKNYEVLYDNEVVKILADKMVEGVELAKPFKEQKKIQAQGLFVMVGFNPVFDFFKDLGVELDQRGYINVDGLMRTNISGVLAAGDCTNETGSFKQVIVSASQGAEAATAAEAYLFALN